jgi:HK97 family phage prohead protease
MKKTNNKHFYPSVELRAYKSDDDEKRMIVEGYAIVFNSESRDLGGFTEIVQPDAVDKALERNSDVLALFDHDYGQILGRQSANTLELSKDERGLKFALDLPDTQLGRDTYTLIERGDLKGNSFGFTIERDNWKKNKDGKVIRTIEEIKDLFEISIVSMPAYEATEVARRSFDEFTASEDEIENVETTENEVYPHTLLKYI